MGHQRLWKVHFHHDGTKTFSTEESMPDSYTVDTSRPIDGKSSHATEAAAHTTARQVSRNGGNARITWRDTITGVETEIRDYAPYEAAVEDLVSPVTIPK